MRMEVVRMRAARWFRLHDDEGMTLVEILVASVIMFIILTAVLGLVAQTTAMGMQAKRKTMLTNAVSAYVERAQGLPFEQVGVAGVDTSGTLDPAYVEDEGEFTITIEPVVSAGPNADVKMLHVDVTLADGRGTETMATDVAIRNRAQYLSQAKSNPGLDPVVSFTLPTPPEGAVAYDDYWLQGTTPRSLVLGLEASASDGRTIESVQVWCDDQWILKGALGSRAQWTVGTQTWSDNSFRWNTRQTEPVVQPDSTTVETEIIPDGLRTLSTYALDSEGVSVYAVRHVLVDNQPPAAPGVPVPAARSSVLTDLSWPAAWDGTTPAHRYRLSTWRIRRDDETPYGMFAYWVPVTLGDPTSSAPAYALPTSAFSRYWVGVRAESPRDLSSAYTAVAGPFTSRPLLTGTSSVTSRVSGKRTYYKTTAALVVTPPNFMVHAGPTYTWTWTYSGGGTGTATTTVPTYSLVGVEHVGAVQPVTVSVSIAYKPVDRLSTDAALLISSNTAGPSATSGSGTLPEGTW